MIIAIAFVVIIILALVYFINDKVGYVVNIAFVICVGLFNYLAFGYLMADTYTMGPLSGYYGETESGTSLLVSILPPIIIVIVSFCLFQGMDKIRDQWRVNRGRKEYENYLKAKSEKIEAEFMAITDYYEYDIRREEFRTLDMDENIRNHLYEIFNSGKPNKETDEEPITALEDGVIEEVFEMTIGDLDVKCAQEIAFNHLNELRKGWNIYADEKKMIEYKKLVDQYVKKIKIIKSEDSNEIISIYDVEKYKTERMWRVELKMKYMQIE